MSDLYDFVGYDSAQTIEEAIDIFEEASETELYAGDERLMLLYSFGYMLDVVMAEINYRANNNIIATCDEETLDMYAAQRCVERISAQKATVTEQFEINEAIGEDITIPKGTRVTQEGTYFFRTTEDAVIPAGDTSVTAVCEATEEGEQYNDIEVGKINILADTIPYITNVTNITSSSGGRDLEELEEYRERVIDAPKGYSTAGSDLAYIAKVKEVDSSIADVCPVYDEPSFVLNLYVLCTDGKLPDENLIKQIHDHVYEKNIKASTDKVEILPAVEKKYSIECTYKIGKEDEDRISEIQENVNAAVENYIKTMYAGMGMAINPETLKRDIYNAGAATAEVTYPVYETLEDFEVAICENQKVGYAGLL